METFVYFVETEGLVKIGSAKRPRARRSNLQIGCPTKISLLGYLPGGEELEVELHQRFDHLRVRGEWFNSSDELTAMIGEAQEYMAEYIANHPRPKRAPRPRNAVFQTVLQIRINPDEKDRWKAAAASENLGLSEWIRRRCEGLREPPVASQGHPSPAGKVLYARATGLPPEKKQTLKEGDQVASTPVMLKRTARIAADEQSGLRSSSLSVCSRTGFPVEACLCPQCKRLKGG